MSAAHLPADEPQRLATLRAYEILDTPPDQAFDRLVQLAAEHFEVPISVVSLIDADRQWFKASVGVSTTETPREYAFCAHAIAQVKDVFVVENATRDPRFADNPFVTGDPSIRFYAGAPIRAANGQPLGTICVIDRKPRQLNTAGANFLAVLAGSVGSMLDLHRKNVILRNYSERDPLTGLANRRVFDSALATACTAAGRGDTFGLLAIDLDHFKKINDEHGHESGDAVLVEVAARLRRVVRAKDLVARLGGDEFAIIACGPIDAAGSATLARRVVNALAPKVLLGDRAVPIGVSIGVALAPEHGSDARAISKAADLALYAGKRGGRGAIVVASEPEQPGGGSSLGAALRDAIANQTLSLHWQPYFASRSSHLKGFEALLRWTPPGGAPVPPLDIIALAEQGGYIAELDAMVLRQACTAAASWPRPLRVSVNMSACWFNSGDLIGLVTGALDASGLAPERLTIELTEQTLVRHTERSRHLITSLHTAGVSIALDDFGTGYASLGYLSSFEFDTVKLDRSFVAGVGNNPRAEAVIHAIVALARALDMAVCAEGVETPEQLRFLQNAGCDLVQGFLLGCPEAAIVWPPPDVADQDKQIAAE